MPLKPYDTDTHHIRIQPSGCQNLLVCDPVKHGNPSKETVRQLRQGRCCISSFSPCSIELCPLRAEGLSNVSWEGRFFLSVEYPQTYTECQKCTQTQYNTNNELRIQITLSPPRLIFPPRLVRSVVRRHGRSNIKNCGRGDRCS